MHPTIPQSLAALLASFPAADSSDPESTARAYLLAIEDISAQFVASAVRRFIRGEVSRDKHTFLPSAPELAIEARRLEKQADVEARLAARAALPKPQDEPSKPKTAEEREKVAALMESLALGLKGHKRAQDDLLRSAEHIRARAETVSLDGITLSPAALARVGINLDQNEV